MPKTVSQDDIGAPWNFGLDKAKLSAYLRWMADEIQKENVIFKEVSRGVANFPDAWEVHSLKVEFHIKTEAELGS